MLNQMHRTFAGVMALSKAELDFQLSPSLSAKDCSGVLDSMVAQTAAAKSMSSISVSSDIAYGGHPRHRVDLFKPVSAGKPLPCLIFLHGGFWQEGDKSVSGFAAQTFAKKGWAYVSVEYRLTPEATLPQVVDDVQKAVSYINTTAADFGIDPDRIIVAGHSAGAHLAATMTAGLMQTDVSPMIAGAVLISGVFELAPVAKSYVRDLTPMDPGTVADLSPLRSVPKLDRPMHVLIGADEPEAFQVQTAAVHALWAPHLSQLSHHIAPGRDHFDVLWELNDPTSKTFGKILAMV